MAPTATQPWLLLPTELHERVDSVFAERDTNIFELASTNPVALGRALFNYWVQRKRTYNLYEVRVLLDPQSLVEGAATSLALEEIEHTLAVQSLVNEWLKWAEGDFHIPKRFKQAFRRQFPHAADRWETAFGQGPEGFGHLVKGAAISIRDFRESTDLGNDVSDPRQRGEVLGKLDRLGELWDEIAHEKFERWRQAQQIRPEFDMKLW